MDEQSIRAKRQAAEITIEICDLQLDIIDMPDSVEKAEIQQRIAELQSEKAEIMDRVSENKLIEVVEKIVKRKLSEDPYRTINYAPRATSDEELNNAIQVKMFLETLNNKNLSHERIIELLEERFLMNINDSKFKEKIKKFANNGYESLDAATADFLIHISNDRIKMTEIINKIVERKLKSK